MKRYFCQRIICSQNETVLNTVLEIDDNGIISRLIPFKDLTVETSSTIALNGIIAPEIFSIETRNERRPENTKHTENFNYQRLDTENDLQLSANNGKPLILDCGSELVSTVNSILQKHKDILSNIDLFEVIKAFTVYPAVALNQENEIKQGNPIKLTLWPSPESLKQNKNTGIQFRII